MQRKVLFEIFKIKNLMKMLNENLESITGLKKGSVGEEVSYLQELLGVYKDSRFGNQTESCLKDFQKSQSIEPSGLVDTMTLESLEKLSDGIISNWKTPEYCRIKGGKPTDNNVDTSTSDTSVKGGNSSAILMTGLQSAKSHNGQLQDFKSGFGEDKEVLSFTYKDLGGLLNAVKQNPDIPVVLFSAGAANSSQVANAISNKSNLYIVEPFNGRSKSVANAVSSGVPSKNVYIGPVRARGLGIVQGATSIPSGLNHFQALKHVGSLLK
jgi:hypothetical protein